MSKIITSPDFLKIETNSGEPLVALLSGENRTHLVTLPSESVSCIIQDEPYGLNCKAVNIRAFLTAALNNQDYQRQGGGLDKREWDADIPPLSHRFDSFRVLKAGGYSATFTSNKNVDLVMIALRLAGFEIVELLAWIHTQGFPKSAHYDHHFESEFELKRYSGARQDLTPAMEIIVLARKPIGEKDYITNHKKHGTGLFNAKEVKINSTYGAKTHAKNVLVEDNYSVLKHFGNKSSKFEAIPFLPVDFEIEQALIFSKASQKQKDRGLESEDTPYQKYNVFKGRKIAGKNHHVTVKPLNLMRHLVKMLSFSGDIVLDSFSGSFTTGVAAVLEGRRFIGMELMPDYFDIGSRKVKNIFLENEGQYLATYKELLIFEGDKKIRAATNELEKRKLTFELQVKLYKLDAEIRDLKSAA
jgi:site-specific DNA-methyltransferase (adenine-specific)